MTYQRLGRVNSFIRTLVGVMWMSLLTIPFVVITPIFWASRPIRIRIGNVYGKLLGYGIAHIIGANITGFSRDQMDATAPAIYLANHNSTLDMFMGMWFCPYGGVGVAKREVVRIPIFGWAYKLSGHLLLDRSNRESAIASMKRLTDIVRLNRLSIWIWPEGTRSRTGDLLPFKKGFVHLAIATGLPVVPIVQHNAYQVWPADSFRYSPGEVNVEILDPIDTTDWSTDTIDEHIEMVRTLFLAKLAVSGEST